VNSLRAASFFLRRASAQGHSRAEYVMALFHKAGCEGVVPSARRYLAFLQRAARHGLPAAQLELGSLYTRGHLLPKDLNRGRRLLRKAAQCGEVDAWKQLALAVPEESAVWWEKAAKQGDAEALYVLAMRALNQYPDLSPALTSAQAIEQLKAAANKNWPEALHALGELYRGVAHPAHSYRLTERSVSELVRRDCVKSSRHLALACDALLSQRRELEKQNGAYEEKLLTVMVDFDAAISNQLLLSRVVHAWGAFVRRRKISLRKLVGKARQSFCRPTFGIWRQLVLRRFLDLRAAIEQPYDFGRLTGLCFAQWAFRVVVLPKRLGKIAATRARERSLRKVLQSWRIFSVRRRTAVFLLAETLRANLRRKELFPPAAVRRVYRGARLFTRLANRKLLTSGFAQLKLHGTKRGAEKRLVPEVERLTSENASLGEDLKIAFQRLADLEKANAHWQKRYDEEHSLNQRLLQSGLSGMPVAVAPENTTTFSTLLQQGTKSCDDEFMMRQGSPTLPVRAPRSAVGSKRSVVSLLSQTAEFVAGVAGESASKSSVVHQPFVFPSQLQTDQPQPQTTAELEDGAGGAADHEFAFRPRVRCSPPGAGDAADGGASSLDERIRELLGDDDPANIVAQHVEPSPTTTDGAQVFPDQQDEALRSNQMLFPSPARRLMQREVRSSRERLRGVLQQTRTSSDDEAALLASTSLEESDEFQDAESSASELVHLRDRWLRSSTSRKRSRDHDRQKKRGPSGEGSRIRTASTSGGGALSGLVGGAGAGPNIDGLLVRNSSLRRSLRSHTTPVGNGLRTSSSCSVVPPMQRSVRFSTASIQRTPSSRGRMLGASHTSTSASSLQPGPLQKYLSGGFGGSSQQNKQVVPSLIRQSGRSSAATTVAPTSSARRTISSSISTARGSTRPFQDGRTAEQIIASIEAEKRLFVDDGLDGSEISSVALVAGGGLGGAALISSAHDDDFTGTQLPAANSAALSSSSSSLVEKQPPHAQGGQHNPSHSGAENFLDRSSLDATDVRRNLYQTPPVRGSSERNIF